jgi:hypothetical protein
VLTFNHTVTVNAPLDTVYDYLVDFTRVSDWDPRASRADLVTGDGGPGTVYSCVLFHLGRPTTVRYTLVSLDRPKEIQWVGRSRAMTQRDVLRLQHDPRGTTVVECYSFFSYPALRGRTSESLLTMPLRQLCDRRQQGLQTALEQLTMVRPVRRDTPA